VVISYLAAGSGRDNSTFIWALSSGRTALRVWVDFVISARRRISACERMETANQTHDLGRRVSRRRRPGFHVDVEIVQHERLLHGVDDGLRGLARRQHFRHSHTSRVAEPITLPAPRSLAGLLN
jgi:hypothetical protein